MNGLHLNQSFKNEEGPKSKKQVVGCNLLVTLNIPSCRKNSSKLKLLKHEQLTGVIKSRGI